MELDTVVGQGTALRPVLHWLSAKLQGKPVPAKCWCFLGEPGVGKTHSAKSLAKDLGAKDDLSGLYEVTASELSIDKCRQLFDRDLRLCNMFELELVYHAGDKHAVYCRCRKCGAVGDVMSRNWNYDKLAGAWEPQARHIPACDHLAVLREASKGVVAKFTGIVPRLT